MHTGATSRLRFRVYCRKLLSTLGLYVASPRRWRKGGRQGSSGQLGGPSTSIISIDVINLKVAFEDSEENLEQRSRFVISEALKYYNVS